MRPNIVFLYTEVADYFLAGVKNLSKHANILIIRWSVNQEAPFEIDEDCPFTMLSKDETGGDNKLLTTVKDFQPDLIICSGWMDKDYIKLCKSLKDVKQIIAFDNHWTGNIKQRLASTVARKTVLKTFNGAWVPGKPQVEFAKKLGFKPKHIHKGFYCANTELFKMNSKEAREKKWKEGLPKRFLYVGRYVEHKGIFEMWKAFKEVHQLHPDWELWCVGTGESYDQRIEGEGIKHFGFVQPKDFKEIINETGAFILPSHFEPWGVVVHEYAVSGYPLLLCDAVGSATEFLTPNANGFLFESGSKEGIKNAMLKYISLHPDKKIKQSKLAHKQGCSYATSDWSQKLLSFID